MDSETKQDLDTTKEALSDLADCLDQPGAKIVTNMLFNSVFGNDDNDVEHALQRIVSQLDQIQKQMSNLVDKIENTSIRTMLKNQISNYHNVSKQFKVAYKVYLESERIINELPESDFRNKEVKQMFSEINDSTLIGTDFHTAVQTLGEIILSPEEDNAMNLFDTYNALIKYTYKWEHQGYGARRAFQAHTLTLYTGLATLSLLSLTAKIDEQEAAGMPTAVDKSKLNCLKEQIKQIDKLADIYTIEILPGNQRRYQVPGHELLLSAITYPRTINPNYPNNPNRTLDYGDLERGMLSYQSVAGGEFNAPPASWFQNVLLDYGQTDLRNIFFNVNEGNFTPPSNINMSINPWYYTGGWYGNNGKKVGNYYFPGVRSDGVADSAWLCEINYGNKPDNLIARNWNSGFYMVGFVVLQETPVLQTPGEEPIKISGMAKSYKASYEKDIVLSVENKEGLYDYEWQMSKDGVTWQLVEGAKSSSFPIVSVDASMNGYQYRCLIIENTLDGSPALTVATETVTLKLKSDNNFFKIGILVLLVLCIGTIFLIFIKKTYPKVKAR